MSQLQSEEAPLENLSDEQLWLIVDQPFSSSQNARLSKLTERGKQGGLSESDKTELETLMSDFDTYVLRRSQALLLLKQRDHNVEQRLKSGS